MDCLWLDWVSFSGSLAVIWWTEPTLQSLRVLLSINRLPENLVR
ncbi:hypothetical protein ACKLNO_06140 [Neisseriaceae bacterium B1]